MDTIRAQVEPNDPVRAQPVEQTGERLVRLSVCAGKTEVLRH